MLEQADVDVDVDLCLRFRLITLELVYTIETILKKISQCLNHFSVNDTQNQILCFQFEWMGKNNR